MVPRVRRCSSIFVTPRDAHLVPVPALVCLDVLIEEESLDPAEVIDYRNRPYISSVIPFDEPVQDNLHVLVVDFGNLFLVGEPPELRRATS
jgi:hypothetical protein